MKDYFKKSRRVLALVLAMLVAVSMMPVQNVQAATTYKISGTITKADDKKVLKGATVIIKKGTKQVAKLTTGTDGKYTKSGLAKGEYTVAVSATGYNTYTFPKFNLASNTTKSKALVTKTFEVKGSVKDSAKKVVADATVKLMKGTATVGTKTTDKSGNYKFTGVKYGTGYKIVVSKTGFKTSTIATDVKAAVTKAVTLVKNAPAKYTVSGVVKDGTKLVSDAKVTLKKGTATIGTPVTTKADGKYSFANVVSATSGYTIEVTKAGYDKKMVASFGVTKNTVKDVSITKTTLSSIAIKTPATKLTYKVGETLDITGLTINGKYSDGSTKVVAITKSNVTGFDSSKAVASQTLTVNVSGKTTTYTIKIEAAPVATLSSIALNTTGAKLVYNVNDTLDITGIVVTGTYSDGTTKPETITIANVTGFDSSKAATSQTLTVTVGGKTATYNVQIKEVAAPTLESIALNTTAAKVVYNVNDTLDVTGVVVTGTYSDNTTKIEAITTANVTGFDSAAPATSQTLTVTVGGKTATYNVEIKAVAVVEELVSITSPTVTVAHGATLTAAKTALTDNVDIVTSTGTTKKATVVWGADTTPVFDGTKAGTYVLSGDVTLPEIVKNTAAVSLKVSANIVVSATGAKYKVTGKIIGSDAATGLAATLQLKDSAGLEVGALITASADGTFEITDVVPGTGYTIAVAKAGYISGTIASFVVADKDVAIPTFTLEKEVINAIAVQSVNVVDSTTIEATLVAVATTAPVAAAFNVKVGTEAVTVTAAPTLKLGTTKTYSLKVNLTGKEGVLKVNDIAATSNVDYKKPTITNVEALSNTTILVTFSEKMGNNALTETNYSLYNSSTGVLAPCVTVPNKGGANLAIATAFADTDKTKVKIFIKDIGTLTGYPVNGLSSGAFILYTSNVADTNTNVIVPNSNKQFNGTLTPDASSPELVTAKYDTGLGILDLSFDKAPAPVSALNGAKFSIINGSKTVTLTNVAGIVTGNTVSFTLTAAQKTALGDLVAGAKATIAVGGIADTSANSNTTVLESVIAATVRPAIAASSYDEATNKIVVNFSAPIKVGTINAGKIKVQWAASEAGTYADLAVLNSTNYVVETTSSLSNSVTFKLDQTAINLMNAKRAIATTSYKIALQDSAVEDAESVTNDIATPGGTDWQSAALSYAKSTSSPAIDTAKFYTTADSKTLAFVGDTAGVQANTLYVKFDKRLKTGVAPTGLTLEYGTTTPKSSISLTTSTADVGAITLLADEMTYAVTVTGGAGLTAITSGTAEVKIATGTSITDPNGNAVTSSTKVVTYLNNVAQGAVSASDYTGTTATANKSHSLRQIYLMTATNFSPTVKTLTNSDFKVYLATNPTATRAIESVKVLNLDSTNASQYKVVCITLASGSELTAGTSYKVEYNNLIDSLNNPIANGVTAAFTAQADITAPTLKTGNTNADGKIYNDNDNDSLASAGDTITLKFIEPVQAITTATLGAAYGSLATFAVDANESNVVTITLGGTGINIANNMNIQTGTASTAAGYDFVKDISGAVFNGSTTTVPIPATVGEPAVKSAVYTDSNNDGAISEGDTMVVKFTKTLKAQTLTPSSFTLSAGRLGDAITNVVISGDTVTFKLGRNPSIVWAGAGVSATTTIAATATILGSWGDPATTTAVDITIPANVSAPVLKGVSYNPDTKRFTMTFNKEIQVYSHGSAPLAKLIAEKFGAAAGTSASATDGVLSADKKSYYITLSGAQIQQGTQLYVSAGVFGGGTNNASRICDVYGKLASRENTDAYPVTIESIPKFTIGWFEDDTHVDVVMPEISGNLVASSFTLTDLSDSTVKTVSAIGAYTSGEYKLTVPALASGVTYSLKLDLGGAGASYTTKFRVYHTTSTLTTTDNIITTGSTITFEDGEYLQIGTAATTAVYDTSSTHVRVDGTLVMKAGSKLAIQENNDIYISASGSVDLAEGVATGSGGTIIATTAATYKNGTTLITGTSANGALFTVGANGELGHFLSAVSNNQFVVWQHDSSLVPAQAGVVTLNKDLVLSKLLKVETNGALIVAPGVTLDGKNSSGRVIVKKSATLLNQGNLLTAGRAAILGGVLTNYQGSTYTEGGTEIVGGSTAYFTPGNNGEVMIFGPAVGETSVRDYSLRKADGTNAAEVTINTLALANGDLLEVQAKVTAKVRALSSAATGAIELKGAGTDNAAKLVGFATGSTITGANLTITGAGADTTDGNFYNSSGDKELYTSKTYTWDLTAGKGSIPGWK